MLGKVTRKNMVQALAPSERATISSSPPCCCISGINSRTTKGKVMNKVASTMPGRANRMRMSHSRSQSANQPEAPNSNTRHKPATTGDTANGRSISASSTRLPRKAKRVIVHAVSMPKKALTGITMAATVRLSSSAASASGSAIAAHHSENPLPKAEASTTSSGSTTSSAIIRTASPIRPRRTQAGSRCSGDISLLLASVREQQRDQIDRQKAQE